jgi:4-amino-4-deoxy-L-arabinose transferase-like glycosyltransferase
MAEAGKPILPLAWLRGIAVLLLAIKLAMLVVTPVFMDEAYYWLWGQHPDLSYFDHPPLNAWLQAISAAAFGWSRLGMRAMVMATLVGDLWLLHLFARSLAPSKQAETFWLSAILFLATPVFFALTGLALPDHVLVFFGLLALYGFHRFLFDWRGGKANPYPFLYLGGVALGLAVLAKYNGVLLGAGFVAFLAGSRTYRPLLKDKHLYLALSLGVLMQAPVLIWNVQHGLASFDFILGTRHGGQSNAAALSGLIGFLGGLIGLLGPFLLLPLGRLLLARRDEVQGAGLGRAVFWVSSAVILSASLLTDVLFHWNLVAYIGVLPFLAPFLRERWALFGQILYGLVAATLAFVNYAIVPVMALVSWADQTSAWSYGWEEVAPRVQAIAAASDADFIATTDYGLASQLGFALKDRDVTSLNPRRDQFDFWFEPSTHAAGRAVIVSDLWRPLTEEIEARFERVTPVETVAVSRQGIGVATYQISLGEGYRPEAVAD